MVGVLLNSENEKFLFLHYPFCIGFESGVPQTDFFHKWATHFGPSSSNLHIIIQVLFNYNGLNSAGASAAALADNDTPTTPVI